MEQKRMAKEKLWDSVPGFDFDEEVDVSELHSWFLDGSHSFPRFTPMFSWFWIRYCAYGGEYGAEMMSLPRSKSFTLREFEGGSYIGNRIIRDEAEIEKRTPKFKEAILPWVEDFDGKWEGLKNELLSMYKPLQDVDLDKATNIDLMHLLWDLISMYRRMWEIHFLVMYPSFCAFNLLEETLPRFGITSQSPEFHKMLRGFDNLVFQTDKQLWDLAQDAIDGGIQDVFKNNEAEDVLAKLEETNDGRKWKETFQEFLNKNGWRMVRMCDFNEPYWLEQPSAAISIIQNFIVKGVDYNLDKVRANLVEEREKTIEELMVKVPSDEREWIKALIELAQKASAVSEEHDLYCELYAHAIIRRSLLGIGKRLAQAGTIDKPDDIFFLNPDEVEMVMIGPEFHGLQYIVNRRRPQWEKLRYEQPPPVFTDRKDIEEAIGMDLAAAAEPIIMHVAGLEMPEPRPELEADIRGVSASPGTAEGLARVIMDYDQLKEVQAGEILVCPITNPAWTPIFGLINAVVTDRGGLLSHAAIVGREYGIPTIVNTFTATSTIKTGQRIRVDATNGAIFLLDK
jgi:pyruvate,water dikinase